MPIFPASRCLEPPAWPRIPSNGASSPALSPPTGSAIRRRRGRSRRAPPAGRGGGVEGGGWGGVLVGVGVRLGAAVVQACAVTLEPVPARVAADFAVLYAV